jgi:hypothetical protein
VGGQFQIRLGPTVQPFPVADRRKTYLGSSDRYSEMRNLIAMSSPAAIIDHSSGVRRLTFFFFFLLQRAV